MDDGEELLFKEEAVSSFPSEYFAQLEIAMCVQKLKDSVCWKTKSC